MLIVIVEFSEVDVVVKIRTLFAPKNLAYNMKYPFLDYFHNFATSEILT